MTLLLVSLISAHCFLIDTVPSSEIFCAPYHGRFTQYKDQDSLTVEEFLNAGPIICEHPAFKIVSFRWGEAGTCLGGTFLLGVEVKGDILPKKDRELIKSFWPGTTLFFDDILAINRVGRLFYLQVFSVRIVEHR